MDWYTNITKDHSRPAVPAEIDTRKYGAVTLGPDEKKVYLTFDAGYENGNVAKIADVLHENGVCGTFFILPNILDTDTDLIRRLADEGNLICSHTCSHPDMTRLSREAFRKELVGMEEKYFEKTGRPLDKYYRPPMGKVSEQNLEWANELGYRTVLWSVAYKDWDNDAQPDRKKALDTLLSRAHNGAVYLLHPTSATNAAILGDFIRELKSMGYEFGLVSEIP